ncbi:hypothetical protein PsorP6_001126 [Peronosclerospora sorghi]|uniref:Uncharacterized protein n=1 Tax=Peronosclerospora sorghi TaxID=230839 RepID=A0ACC0WTE1_9STRA|nr:hypothetical protein PsorP6_001126 [Peronosclerospora sorghi]
MNKPKLFSLKNINVDELSKSNAPQEAVAGRAQEQQHGPPPTSKPFLDKVPVKVWTQEMEKTENQRECVICLSDYEKDVTIISLRAATPSTRVVA